MIDCNHEWHLSESDYNHAGGKRRKPYKGRAFFVCSKCGEWKKEVKEKNKTKKEITPTTFKEDISPFIVLAISAIIVGFGLLFSYI